MAERRDTSGWAMLAILGALVLMATCSGCSMLFPATTEVLGDDQEAFWIAVGADLEALVESFLYLLGVLGL